MLVLFAAFTVIGLRSRPDPARDSRTALVVTVLVIAYVTLRGRLW